MDSRSGKLRARWGGDAKLSPEMAELCSLTINRRRGPPSRAAIEMSLCSVTPNLLYANILFLWCRPLGTTQSQLSRRSSRPRLDPHEAPRLRRDPRTSGPRAAAARLRTGRVTRSVQRRACAGGAVIRGPGRRPQQRPAVPAPPSPAASVPPWCWSRWSRTC